MLRDLVEVPLPSKRIAEDTMPMLIQAVRRCSSTHGIDIHIMISFPHSTEGFLPRGQDETDVFCTIQCPSYGITLVRKAIETLAWKRN